MRRSRVGLFSSTFSMPESKPYEESLYFGDVEVRFDGFGTWNAADCNLTRQLLSAVNEPVSSTTLRSSESRATNLSFNNSLVVE